ncbi:hypothetical protein Cgig2_020502 [Carnegiea gigantea]|uniref:Isochorismatase-like domain-containing protein n=1 Tax=Carnegiea gigantea TaxID=171969 RepID=A0A9Q1KAN7_9CARY|nr:hypothetical protein Cgig2_020502 [Carnegiea gigantea]
MDHKWKNTALLVIDMQKDFILPGGPLAVDGGAAIVPNVIKVVQVARERGMLVVWRITNQERMKMREQDTTQRWKSSPELKTSRPTPPPGCPRNRTPKQCADEIPVKFRSPEKSPATDLLAQRGPAGTETADQPSPHFSEGENPPPGGKSEKTHLKNTKN